MKHSNAGYSLLEITISIAILSTIFLISIDSYVKAEKAVEVQNQTNTRIRAFQSLITIMGMPAALRAAAYLDGDSNPLNECVFGSHGSCPPVTINTWQPLALLLPPRNAAGTTVELSGAISGGPGHPILYSFDGVACNPDTDSSCTTDEYPIAVTTEWQTVCPPKSDTTYNLTATPWTASDGTNHLNPEGLQFHNWCPVAQYIRIRYEFKLANGAPEKYGFKTVTGTIMVSASAAKFTY